MSDQKPLPPIPTNSTTLSIDARSHRARLIRQILSEIHDPEIESRQDGWSVVFEEALDSLGNAVSNGNWLSSIMRGRRAKQITQQNLNCVEVSKESRDASSRRSGPGQSQTRRPSHDQKEAKTEKLVQDDLALDSSTHQAQALQQIRTLAVRHNSLSPSPSVSHLLLCVAPFGNEIQLSPGVRNFDSGPPSISCVFYPGVFSLPEDNSDNPEYIILNGLREWDVFASRDVSFRIVGGTFQFKGIHSPLQHLHLSRSLKLSIYIHLALILEQHFLLDSHVAIKFPRPRLPAPSPSVPSRPPLKQQENEERKSKNSSSLFPPSLFSFFSKKTFNRRSQTISPMAGRGGSLDLAIISPNVSQQNHSPRMSVDTGSRLHRFSFMGDRRPSLRKTDQLKEDPEKPLQSSLQRIEASNSLLSTSFGIVFKPPLLIEELALKEKLEPNRRLKGDERAGLSTLLGWTGKESRGRGMSGVLGFIRQQELSVLYSQHVPSVSPSKDVSESSKASSPSPLHLSFSKPEFSVCGRPQWKTYRYFSCNSMEDKVLGETIIDLVKKAENPCEGKGCNFKQGEHEIRLIHAGLRISIGLEKRVIEGQPEEDSKLDAWESCAVCEAKTSRSKMSDGTYLLSFGKFLELLMYSPILCLLTPKLCEHTSSSSSTSPDLPRSRFNILRHFATPDIIITFTLSVVDDIFELRVPRLQITRSGDKSSRTFSMDQENQESEGDPDEDKKILRREIKLWWEGVGDHMDKLERILVGENAHSSHKSLPRLPSADDAYEDLDYLQTPRQSIIIPPPPSTPNPPVGNTILDCTATTERPTAEPMSSTIPRSEDPIHLLASLREAFHSIEQSLYAQLSRTPTSSLNDVRRLFLSAAKGTHRRLSAWQKKHLQSNLHLLGELSIDEPGWWGKGCHAVPGGNVIVREDDWGSIIAFTLSTADYQRELINLSVVRTASQSASSAAGPSSPTSSSSIFAVAAGYRLFSSSAHKQPDPDQEDVIWHEPEPYSAAISRKQHVQDPASLLSIRDMLRQRAPFEAHGTLLTSRSTIMPGSQSHPNVPSTSSVWAKPNVGVSMQEASGEVSGLPDSAGMIGRILQEIHLEASSPEVSRPVSVMSEASSSNIDAHIRRGKASSIVSIESNATIGKDSTSPNQQRTSSPNSKDDTNEPENEDSGTAVTPPPPISKSTTSSSIASSLASGFSHAMRLVLQNHEVPRTPSSVKNHHGLLDVSSIDERPHIKYDWTVAKRLKFSCTVYYAKQFDTLRRRCGIENIYLKSLSRSANWTADGGKSRSNFWKTSDNRFIIKTLVNAWNVADLQVLIELAPSYFKYMESTASKATVLAKMIGFYTIEIRNLETGNVQSKADLLVMENLFYNRDVNKTFDLKGIQGRKVKAVSDTSTGSHTSKTLYDGEWIEGQQRALMLVRPHSKHILHEALKSDAEFLTKCNIMDYSLLLGVDEGKKQIACGLVDTIGSYTFAKTLEYKAKFGLQSGKDITVIPPAEYQERFINALEGYFVACPDKWSKSQDDSKIISDPNALPSVL